MQLQAIAFVLALVASVVDAAPSANGTLVARSHNGIATVYQQMGAYGSCGERHADSDLVAAIANGKSHCGAQIRMTNKGGHSDVGGAGRVITTWVKDTCTGCDANHVDLSVGSWNDLTGGSPWGVTDIEWDFV